MQRKIGSNPCSFFRSLRFQEICGKYLIEHSEFPIVDYGCNGKIERCLHILSDRIRAKYRVVLECSNTGLSEILFVLKTARGDRQRSAAELHLGRKLKELGDLLKPRNLFFDSKSKKFSGATSVELLLWSRADTTSLMMERARLLKLEAYFKKKGGRIISETPHITLLRPAS